MHRGVLRSFTPSLTFSLSGQLNDDCVLLSLQKTDYTKTALEKCMKLSLSSAFLLLLIGLAACGSPSQPRPQPQIIDGVWTAQLSNSDGSSAFAFQSTLARATAPDLAVPMFAFTVPTSCLSGQTSQSGSLTQSAVVHGILTGKFTLTVISSGDRLKLQGDVSGTSISGAWNLSGRAPACNGSGNFQMKKLLAL
jgi:hypothetical protein